MRLLIYTLDDGNRLTSDPADAKHRIHIQDCPDTHHNHEHDYTKKGLPVKFRCGGGLALGQLAAMLQFYPGVGGGSLMSWL